MKVKLLNDTLVRFDKGTVLEVSEAEGKRLIAFNNASEVKETKKAKKGKE